MSDVPLFADRNFTKRVRTRYDAEVDFNWSDATPDPAIRSDAFSVRWTGYLRAPVPGAYKLIMYSDDVAKVWLDDKLIIQGGAAQQAIGELGKRPHKLRIDFEEHGGPGYMTFHWRLPGAKVESVVPAEVLFVDEKSAAKAKLGKRAVPPKGTGVLTEVFAGTKLERRLLQRVDRQIDWLGFDGAYEAGLPADQFSIRFTTWLKAPEPGAYKLILHSDNGTRLWIDGKQLIDAWEERGYRTEVLAELTDKPHALRVEYFESWGQAHVSLHWQQVNGFGEQIIPPEAFFTDKGEAARKR